jgi:Ca-activated chloride channel family protein
MSFVNTHYLYYILAASVVLVWIIIRSNSRFFSWIKTYWFMDRTISSRLSGFLYLCSLILLMLSLLDLRGPEKKMRANLPDQQTIILIDSSASMLAEDVRPNRFVKSLQLARHFVKSSPGHQISIVLFSDIQKRLVPFTDDVDLLDSRLAALEKTNSVGGGSNISQAIQESTQYFDASENGSNKAGNMIVFSDAEESEGELSFSLSSDINLAVVGVGTARGSNIPLRWEDGSFRGYKMHKGEQVVTKLDENYISKMGKNAKSFKFWIANSYSLPTEDILNFFRATYNKKQNNGDIRVRPVYSHYILIPAVLIYILSVIFGRLSILKIPKSVQSFVLFALLIFPVYSGFCEEEAPKEAPLSPELARDLDVVKTGKADRQYTLKVAEKLLKEKQDAKALNLYTEYGKKNDEEAVRFNYATSLLKNNKRKEALPVIEDLLKNSKNEDLKQKLRANLMLNIKQEKQKEQNKEQNKDQKNEDQKDQNNKDDNKDKKDNKDNKDNKENKDKQDKQNNKDKKENKDNKNNKDGKQDSKSDQSQQKPQDKDKKEEKDNKAKEKSKEKSKEEQEREDQMNQGPQSLEEKEKQIDQKRKMLKTPAMIKQILNDDRDLQKKMMDTSTNERGADRAKRDW